MKLFEPIFKYWFGESNNLCMCSLDPAKLSMYYSYGVIHKLCWQEGVLEISLRKFCSLFDFFKRVDTFERRVDFYQPEEEWAVGGKVKEFIHEVCEWPQMECKCMNESVLKPFSINFELKSKQEGDFFHNAYPLYRAVIMLKIFCINFLTFLSVRSSFVSPFIGV